MKITHDVSAATAIKVTALSMLTRFAVRLLCLAAILGVEAAAYYTIAHH